VLRRHGFTLRYEGETPAGLDHADMWMPDEGDVTVDLHWTLVGVNADPPDCWRLLAASTEKLVVGGAELEALSPAGCAFVVAQHAAYHGPARSQGVTDLERALENLDERTWRAASVLANRLQATEMFGAGLRLVPPGEAMAAELGLPRHKSIQTALLSSSAPPPALGVERLVRTQGLRQKLMLVAREVVPSREFMRVWWPRAERGGLWLIGAYLWRPLWLLIHAGPSLAAWRRAVREARGA
jgi:hypothetical protein